MFAELFTTFPPGRPHFPLTERHNSKSTNSFISFLETYLPYNPYLFLSTILWLLFLFFCFRQIPVQSPQNEMVTCDAGDSYVYVYDLPAEFNVGLLEHCHHVSVSADICPHVANRGLGQPLSAATNSWFATNPFTSEMIFHARMENHPCRTRDSTRAKLFYVPFYGGLHASSKFRDPNLTERDALAVRLVEFLQTQPTWQNRNGRDHFLALGRTAWDFMRPTKAIGPGSGANSLLNLKPIQNMSVLIVERNPWAGSNQYGIPYPSYFHPATSDEMVTWQNKMREAKRPYLFSFVGAPRKGVKKAALRNDIVRQCDMSSRCKVVNRGGGRAKEWFFDPVQVLKVMSESEFCLQAAGDSFTRRSMFDSILAGCIPVFFSRERAYRQYKWYLGEEGESCSVLIDENGEGRERIEKELLKIPKEEVKRMREKVVNLIPRVTYKHPNATEFEFEDAVDVALAGLVRLARRNPF